jgi:MFS superfamily sulfate permease-like transporter
MSFATYFFGFVCGIIVGVIQTLLFVKDIIIKYEKEKR